MADKPKYAAEYTSEQAGKALPHDAVGPMRVAAFITGHYDDELQADVVGFVSALLTALR